MKQLFLKKHITVIIAACLILSLSGAVEIHAASKVIGEAFGKPVTEEEFGYYNKTASIFTRTGKQSRTEDDTRAEAWQNLIFSHEAKALKMLVLKDELTDELKRLLSEKNIEYGTNAYKIWVASQMGESVDVFENRIRDLLLINKFMNAKMNPEVSITEEEMVSRYRNQYSSFEIEYIWFEDEAKALEFLGKVKASPKVWKETFDVKRKELGQKGAAWINMMSLEAMIDLWKIPTDDAYRVLEYKEGDFLKIKNYYGDVAIRLLDKKAANMKEYDEKKKEYYRNMLTSTRKRKIVQDYFDDLFKRAGVKDFVAEAKQKAKIEVLKKKSDLVLETNQGNIELKLFPDIAPFACENFVGLVEKGYYNGLTFHRVKKDFMIQAGDPTGTGAGGESIWGSEFRDEISDKMRFDKPGVLAMANSGPDTNKSQFFITTAPAAWLDGKHTIFGEIVGGMDAVKKIENTPVGPADKPKEDQKIIKAYIKGV